MDLDGMTPLVRSEVDACEGIGEPRPAGANKKPSSVSAAPAAEDLLVEQLGGLLLSSSGGGKCEVRRRDYKFCT